MREKLLQKIESEMSEVPDTRVVIMANLSAEQIAAELSSAQAVKKFFGRSLYPVLAVTAVLVACIASICGDQDPARHVFKWVYVDLIPNFLLLSAVSLPFAWGMVTQARVESGGGSYRIKMLTPIAQTDQCQTALKALQEGGPDVAEWRDSAIALRGQLYGFDVEVMEWLCKVHCRELAAKEKAEKMHKPVRWFIKSPNAPSRQTQRQHCVLEITDSIMII